MKLKALVNDAFVILGTSVQHDKIMRSREDGELHTVADTTKIVFPCLFVASRPDLFTRLVLIREIA